MLIIILAYPNNIFLLHNMLFPNFLSHHYTHKNMYLMIFSILQGVKGVF